MPITVLEKRVDVLTGSDRILGCSGMFVGFRIRDAGTQPRPKIQESITNGVTDRSSNLHQPTEHTVLKLSSSQGFWFLPTLNQPPTLDSSNANNHIGRLPPAVSPLPEESSCYSGRYVAQHTYVMRATRRYKHGIRTTRPTSRTCTSFFLPRGVLQQLTLDS